MKKNNSRILIILAALLSLSTAQAGVVLGVDTGIGGMQNTEVTPAMVNDFFAKGNIHPTTNTYNNINQSVYRPYIGYAFTQGHWQFGPELGYWNYGDNHYQVYGNFQYPGTPMSSVFNITINDSGYAVDLLMDVRYVFNHQFSAFVKAGPAYVTQKTSIIITIMSRNIQDQIDKYAILPEGVIGASYQLTPALAIDASYQIIMAGSGGADFNAVVENNVQVSTVASYMLGMHYNF